MYLRGKESTPQVMELHKPRTRTDMRTNTKYEIKTEISYFFLASSKVLRFGVIKFPFFVPWPNFLFLVDRPQSQFLSSHDSE